MYAPLLFIRLPGLIPFCYLRHFLLLYPTQFMDSLLRMLHSIPKQMGQSSTHAFDGVCLEKRYIINESDSQFFSVLCRFNGKIEV
ncbi:MAG TPA: hypothetical protein VJW20_04250 [Candidatus Angelobacter sp.]|nr:hypothetical protein [Candidatus Angelobacter sp.]